VRAATIHLPFLTARFEIPRHPGTPPGVAGMNGGGGVGAGTAGMPAGAEAGEEAETVEAGPREADARADLGGRFGLVPVPVVSKGKAAYYVGLGLLAAVEIVEWPVAAAIAAGTYVAQHAGWAAAPRRLVRGGRAGGRARR
jgi:hypothetical protein